ncbi:MAG: hypothetical protein R6U27_01030 [Desulfobacterales bacterium]
MLSFLKPMPQIPDLNDFSLEPYRVNFSLSQLVPGVDNVRYDVRLSPELLKSTANIIRYLFADHTQSHNIMEIDMKSSWHDFQNEFQEHYCQVLIGAVNQAKMQREIQIDFLAQTAVVKMILLEILSQYEYLVQSYIKAIRKIELSSSKDLRTVIRLKEQLSNIRINRTSIIRSAGMEFFQYLAQIQDQHIAQVREINFGSETAVYADIFTNPILHSEDSHDDFFMMDEYRILLGKRFDDPDQYCTLIDLLKSIFSELFLSGSQPPAEKTSYQKAHGPDGINDLIKQSKNIDSLLNYFDTQTHYNLLKKNKSSKTSLRDLQQTINLQKKLVSVFYKKFNRKGLIKKIIASHQIHPLVRDYCPPLIPQQMVQYILKPSSRRRILRQLKRSKKFYGKNISLKPLKNQASPWKYTLGSKRKEIFIAFLKGFMRYHRDFENYKLLKEAMDYVHIVHDDKTASLSGTNHTLFEFLLPQESGFQEKAIINHVIIKADVRGSTYITRQMKDKGLNPASYFSLNFFDPITEILSDYGAQKVFIEGDAIILAITEHEQAPEGWYSVARACGLAANILSIVKQYNAQCRKKQLPILELGIGISYQNSAPAFLFDEGNKIMISSAINQADRLSGCSKALVKQLEHVKKPFNLYVFRKTFGATRFISNQEKMYVRYNVNGIELSPAAFRKLAEEIELRLIKTVLPEISKENLTLYSGKFQTLSGKFKKLVIREADIMEFVSESETESFKKTAKKYFEVVTNPHVYQSVDKLI